MVAGFSLGTGRTSDSRVFLPDRLEQTTCVAESLSQLETGNRTASEVLQFVR